MGRVNRREFIKQAASCGAALVWCSMGAHASTVRWRERRDLYPEGVASGDPDSGSVILWTRKPFDKGERQILTVEVAEDEVFRRVVALTRAPASPTTNLTARVPVEG